MNDQQQDIRQTPVKQGVQAVSPQPNEIGPATPYDFDGKNLTAYGGLLPVGTLLEKLGFRQLVEDTLKVKRQTKIPMISAGRRTGQRHWVDVAASSSHWLMITILDLLNNRFSLGLDDQIKAVEDGWRKAWMKSPSPGA